MRVSRWAVALVALASAGAAEAAPRITVGPISGDRKSALVLQLASALCSTYECVPRYRILTRGEVDLGKARSLRVAGVLTGGVTGTRNERVLSLALFGKRDGAARRWRLPLTRRGSLAPDSVSQLVHDLEAQFGTAPPPPEPHPATRAPAPSPPARPATPEPPAGAEPATGPVANVAGAGVGTGGTKSRWLAAAEVGACLTKRDLSFDGAGTGSGSLRAYRSNLIGSPRVHLEVFPLSLVTAGPIAGLGLFGDYSFSLGLKTNTGPGTPENGTSFTRLQGGLAWRFHPLSSWRLELIPAISYRRLEFTVSPSIPGLADSHLSGLAGALDLEIPVGGAVAVLVGGGYVQWLVAKDLVKGDVAFFPGGSAHGVEAEAGVSVVLSGPVSLRVLGEYGATTYSLDRDPTGTYVATGAKDEYLGGRVMLRGQY